MKKLKLREPFSSASHLLGALAGIAGAIYLVQITDGSYGAVLTILVYSLALVLLFLISGLLHGLNCCSKTLNWLERLDHAAIYLFIAGTYTPVCLFVIRSDYGLALLAAEWAFALVGVWLAMTRGPASRNLQIIIYLIMGWGFLLVLPSLAIALAPLAFGLLILGCILYSIGAVVFAFDSPALFKTRLSGHDFWHVLVLLGSAAHYIFVAQVIS